MNLCKRNRISFYVILIIIFLSILPTLYRINLTLQQNIKGIAHKRLAHFSKLTTRVNKISKRASIAHVSRQKWLSYSDNTRIGEVTTSIGEVTTSIGEVTTSIGEVTTSIGEVTTSIGEVTTSIGEVTTSDSVIATTVGAMKRAPISDFAWQKRPGIKKRLRNIMEAIEVNVRREPKRSNIKRRERRRGPGNRMYILMWRDSWNIPTDWISIEQYSDCMVTYDRTKLRDAAAVIFHYHALDEERMPWRYYRDPEQVFVFYNLESPPYMYHNEGRQNMRKFDGGFINWTMTYKGDSDVFYPYAYPGSIEKMVAGGKTKLDEMIKLKSRLALWVVSNCGKMYGSRMRMKYANQLVASGLPVDRYGGCFGNTKNYEKLHDVRNTYKFYLAFENSHCKDYMTEKFWVNSIASWRVPVVWGPSKDDVTKLAPPGSFIHVDDFDSPGELTKYLLYLHSNDTAYREYFKWIDEPNSDATVSFLRKYETIRIEQLCEMVKSRKGRKTVKSITDFMYNQERRECLFR